MDPQLTELADGNNKGSIKDQDMEEGKHEDVMVDDKEDQQMVDIDVPPPVVKPVYAQYDASRVNYSPAQTSSPTDILDRYPTHLPYLFHWCISDADYRALATSVALAIKSNILPSRIPQGSSGSYYAKDMLGRIVGIFKPKNEEPYGSMNPRWSKWLQRWCCPCTFGRGCLLTNQGCYSEAAASAVDRHFRINIVPRTEVVELASPSFHYGHWIRKAVERKKKRLRSAAKLDPEDPYGNTLFPRKAGSFQVYVKGFRHAKDVLEEWQRQKEHIPPELDEAFQSEFERLVILDYIIRNTDRGLDNWLVNVSWIREEIAEHELDGSGAPPDVAEYPQDLDEALYETNMRAENVDDTIALLPPNRKGRRPVVKIAGIDNGLAFPYKHPDKWRSYPYGWADLPWASRPFSDRTAAEFLPMLSDPSCWDTLVSRLRHVFWLDDDFSEKVFRRQMAVLRGQLFNLREALRYRESPQQLLERPWLKIEDLQDLSPFRKYTSNGDGKDEHQGKIWHVSKETEGEITTKDRELLGEEGAREPYKDVIPLQHQRWRALVRERPYLANL